MLTAALTTVGCSNRDADSAQKQVQPESAAATGDWRGRDTFCRAASAFTVGSALIADDVRERRLQRMRQNAPVEWQRFLDQAVRRLKTHGDQAPGQRSEFREFTYFVESACDLNLPAPPN